MIRVRRGLLVAALLLAASPAWADRPTDYWQTTTRTATGSAGPAPTADTALWTPASGMRIALQGCIFSADGSVVFEIEISNVDVVPPQRLESAGTISINGGGAPLYVTAVDDVLRYTVSGGSNSRTGVSQANSVPNWSIMCYGYEVHP